MKLRALLFVTLPVFVLTILLVLTFVDTTTVRFILVIVAAPYFLALHYIALWFLVSWRFGVQRAQGTIINVSILLATLAVFTIGAEYFARILFQDVTTTADHRSYFSKLWLKTVRYNRLGFREKEFDPVKPSQIYRIAVIGDSLAYGQGIPEQDRFSNLLEERLNELNKGQYEVLNFAKPGADTSDQLGFLTRAELTARPDYVLLQWYTNDVRVLDEEKQAPNPIAIIPGSLRRNSALFYLIHVELNSLQTRLGLVKDDDRYVAEHLMSPSSPSSIKAANIMISFIQISKKLGIPLGVVVFSESYFKPDSEVDFLADRMLFLCHKQKIRCLDTRPVLRLYQGDTKLWASRLDPHPSVLANQLVADRLMGTFRDVWLAR